MENLTVHCGCGRTMSLDALRGRGAFRCGCGATVRIREARRAFAACVGTVENGSACRESPTTTEPFPLCPSHRRLIKHFVADVAVQQASERHRSAASKNAKTERDGVVYFIRIGDLIKIGKTLDLRGRLATYSYPNLELLATEPGYTVRESQLHSQFVRSRHRGEWFHPTPELLTYIETLPKHGAATRRAVATALRRTPQVVVPNPEALLSSAELAVLFDMPKGTIRGWISQEKIPWQLGNGRRVYRVADIQAIHDRRRPARDH